MVTGSVEAKQMTAFLEDAQKRITDGKELESFFKKWWTKLILDIVKDNPLDTGKSRGGWLPRSAVSRLKGLAGVRVGGKRSEVSAGRKLGRFKMRIRRTKKPFMEQWNGVPYVPLLELGSSRQAPAGMIRKNIRKHVKKLVLGSVKATEKTLQLSNSWARARHRLKQGGKSRG